MAHMVNVYEAKTRLSALLAEVESGGEVVIARAGRPVARLVPAGRAPFHRKPGAWSGRVRIAPDFDDVPEEVMRVLEGRDS